MQSDRYDLHRSKSVSDDYLVTRKGAGISAQVGPDDWEIINDPWPFVFDEEVANEDLEAHGFHYFKPVA